MVSLVVNNFLKIDHCQAQILEYKGAEEPTIELIIQLDDEMKRILRMNTYFLRSSLNNDNSSNQQIFHLHMNSEYLKQSE